jgi:hypothetical protein
MAWRLYSFGLATKPCLPRYGEALRCSRNVITVFHGAPGHEEFRSEDVGLAL